MIADVELSKVLDEENFSILTTTCGVSNLAIALISDTRLHGPRNLQEGGTRQTSRHLGHWCHYVSCSLISFHCC